MSRPFNFFQFAESGQVSAYPSQFSGFYTPRGMVDAPDNYYYRLDQESFETPANYKLDISADLKSTNPDNYNLTFVASGNFFGVSFDDASLIQALSGQCPKTDLDVPTFISSFSGNFTDSNIDIPAMRIVTSGQFPDSYQDLSSIYIFTSGQKMGDSVENATNVSKFTGNFFKYERESVSLGANLSSITWSVGHEKRRLDLGIDTGTLGVTLSKIFWSRAGG
jgi:hypothetical protein